MKTYCLNVSLLSYIICSTRTRGVKSHIIIIHHTAVFSENSDPKGEKEVLINRIQYCSSGALRRDRFEIIGFLIQSSVFV